MQVGAVYDVKRQSRAVRTEKLRYFDEKHDALCLFRHTQKRNIEMYNAKNPDRPTVAYLAYVRVEYQGFVRNEVTE